MSEQKTPAIAETAKPKSEPKSATGRTKAKSTSKIKKVKKRESHGSRPRSTIRYWIEGIEQGRFRGPDLVLAIQRVEDFNRKKEAEKLSRMKPTEGGSKLRAILHRATAPSGQPEVVSNPVTAERSPER